jgi:hypothetical protein
MENSGIEDTTEGFLLPSAESSKKTESDVINVESYDVGVLSFSGSADGGELVGEEGNLG